MLKFRNEIKKSEQKERAIAEPTANLEPKTIEINGCTFKISKMPCTTAQEVLIQLPQGFIPMLNNFAKTQEMAFKMLSFVERVYKDKPNVPLISKEIIDNHVPDFNTLLALEQECLSYNYDFFEPGKVSNFLNKGLCLAESKVSGMLTDLLDRLLQAAEPHSTN